MNIENVLNIIAWIALIAYIIYGIINNYETNKFAKAMLYETKKINRETMTKYGATNRKVFDVFFKPDTKKRWCKDCQLLCDTKQLPCEDCAWWAQTYEEK